MMILGVFYYKRDSTSRPCMYRSHLVLLGQKRRSKAERSGDGYVCQGVPVEAETMTATQLSGEA